MLSFSFENQIAHLLLFYTREVKSYLAPADPAVFVVTLSGGLEEVTDPHQRLVQLPRSQEPPAPSWPVLNTCNFTFHRQDSC